MTKNTASEVNDVIVNYFLEHEQEVYLAQSKKFDTVAIGIKPERGIEVYSQDKNADTTLLKANDLAITVLQRTKGYSAKVKVLNHLKSKNMHKALHKELRAIFKQWDPECYDPDKNNSVFYEGYRHTKRRES